jgi:hypothetical protein
MTVHEGIASIMKEIDAIGKGKRNQQQGWAFRGIDDVYNALHPLLGKYGVFTVPSVVERQDERVEVNGKPWNRVKLRVNYTIFSADGSSIGGSVDAEGLDNGDKATNKALAFAHKYFLLQLFAIPTEDMIDGDAESPPEPPKRSIMDVSEKPMLPTGRYETRPSPDAERVHAEIVECWRGSKAELSRQVGDAEMKKLGDELRAMGHPNAEHFPRLESILALTKEAIAEAKHQKELV